MSVSQLGEALLNKALKNVTLDRRKSQFSKNPIQELPSELLTDNELVTKLKRQTNKAINNLFQGETLTENLKEEDSNNEEDNQEGFDENAMKKNIDIGLTNLKEESFIDSDEDSDESMPSSPKKTYERRERKKIDLNFLKSKRKTINMRLAFLSACKTFEFFFNFVCLCFFNFLLK